jgi:hypothetical protein
MLQDEQGNHSLNQGNFLLAPDCTFYLLGWPAIRVAGVSCLFILGAVVLSGLAWRPVPCYLVLGYSAEKRGRFKWPPPRDSERVPAYWALTARG